jgi:hypothetical protein
MSYKEGEEKWLEEKALQLEDALISDPLQLDELQEICKEYARKFVNSKLSTDN